MKKIITFFIVVLLIGNLAGCGPHSGENNSGKNSAGSNNAENNKSKDPNSTMNNHNTSVNKGKEEQNSSLENINDYFPMKKNVHYVYEGSGNEFASYDVYNDYISGTRVQQRINNGGTTKVNVWELNGGKLSKVYSRGEAYYRENLLNQNGDEEVMLMEPLKKGTTWKLKDGRTRTITNTAVDLTTPAGNYKALEVTTESSKDKTIDYFAKYVGLVKSVFVSGETKISSILTKIEDNAPLVQRINFFYPNINDKKMDYKSKVINFYTNDITRKVLTEAYKQQVNNQLGIVFTKNTEINSLYLNRDGAVYIDLNQAFLHEMSAGAAYEMMILQSVVNTVGQYYQADKVYLTIDQQPYESGHIVMAKGDFFRVQTQNSIEIK